MDRYYSCPGDALEDAEEEDCAEPMLFVCEPEYAQLTDDYFIDIIAEDSDTPKELMDAIGVFNESMKDVVISWMPSKFALDLED
jgi:hypothetical protein